MYPINSIVLYVEDIQESRRFYTELLEYKAQDLSPTFVSVEFGGGPKLELKQKAQSVPPATVTGGGTELSVLVPDAEALRNLHDRWKKKGVRFLQEPTELVFGLTFVALDPDEHRIRIFAEKEG